MRNVKSLFGEEEAKALEAFGVELSDDIDYSADDLDDLYNKITDDFPLGQMFERILDVFIKNKLVRLN